MSQSIEVLGQAGVAALNRGDAAGARKAFEEIVRLGRADAAVWLGIAIAAQAQSDDPAAAVAADRVLAEDSQNLRALLIRAALYERAGDMRAAASFYAAAIGQIPEGASLPGPIQREIDRARTAEAQVRRRMEDHLRARLEAGGYRESAETRRFTQSLELLSGRRQRYESRPRSYFFPELPSIAFHPRERFPWLAALEAQTDAIAGELAPLLETPGAFAPYVEAEADRPTDRDYRLLDNAEWTACYLWRDGVRNEPYASLCPRTMAAMEAIPLETIPKRAPFVLFSKLTPGAWIQPHHGFLNSRLVAHLPLIVPDGCWFRVGAETRSWRRGEAFVFDDTIEHEAKNPTRETRVVLIFNVWRPELTEMERHLVSLLMQAVDDI